MGLDELHDAARGFEAFLDFGHERHAHAPGTGIAAAGFACEVAARQHGHIVLSEEGAGECRVVHPQALGHAGPQVEACVGQGDVHHLREQRRDLLELAPVEGAVLLHVRLVAPGSDAGPLHGRPHGAAVVGAVEQEGLHQGRVACHEAAAQAGQVAALGQAGEGDEVAEIRAAQACRGFQPAERRAALEVDLAVTLVGGDHEAVAVAEREELFPLGQRHDGTRGVARRADEEQLRALPDVLGHGVPVHREIARRIAGGVVRLRARQQRGAFVDLVEGIGADHGGAFARGVDHRLGEREQGLAGAVHGQDLGRGVHRDAVAPVQPLCAGFAQAGIACGGGVAGEAAQVVRQGLLDEGWRGMAGFAHAEADRRKAGGGLHPREELPQPLERVGLQMGEQGIHGAPLSVLRGRPTGPARRIPALSIRRKCLPIPFGEHERSITRKRRQRAWLPSCRCARASGFCAD